MSESITWRERADTMGSGASSASVSPHTVADDDDDDARGRTLHGATITDLDTSIAAPQNVAVSRSADTIGVSLDQLRPCRPRAGRVGAPLSGRREGAGGGGANRHSSSSASRARGPNSAGISAHGAGPAPNNCCSRKSSSCTAQCERLRLDYTFEKPGDSSDAFPSMYEELLRSFEEDEDAKASGQASLDQELALLMSGILSDDEDKENPIPEELLYRIFSGSGRKAQLGSQPTPSVASTSPGCSKTSGGHETSNDLPPNVLSTADLVRPRPPSPLGYNSNPSESDSSLLPSASATLNSSVPQDKKSFMKQTDSSDCDDRAIISRLNCVSSADTSDVCSVENKGVSARSLGNSSVSSSSVLTQMQGGEAHPSNPSLPRQAPKTAQYLDRPSGSKVLSFALLAEVYKEASEATRETEGGSSNYNCLKSAQPKDRLSSMNGDRIRSDKRIPLPEEILLAINRAIDLGKLTTVGAKAQGDSVSSKTEERPINLVGQFNNRPKPLEFPPTSSRFPLGKKANASPSMPLSYFKVSSNTTRLRKVKTLKDADIEKEIKPLSPKEPEDNVTSEIDRPACLTTKSTVRRGPLYRKGCEWAEGMLLDTRKLVNGSETPSEQLSTPPNSPIRDKAGISFSNPVATCVTDCNTNMMSSGVTVTCLGGLENNETSSGGQGETLPPESGSAEVNNTKILSSIPPGAGSGDKAECAGKDLTPSTPPNSDTPPTSSDTKHGLVQSDNLQTSLNSHPSVLLKPLEYLEFFSFLKSKKPVMKEVRRPKTKIFKLQRMMTDLNGDASSVRSLQDARDSMPIFPRGREIPPGWEPGQHGSHPITRISAEYEMAAQLSSKNKKNQWRKVKVRRKPSRRKAKVCPNKQSASDTSVNQSPPPPMVAPKTPKSKRARQESRGDTALPASSEFEGKYQQYEDQRAAKAARDSGKTGKRVKQKKITEQVKFLQTIDDICNAEDEEFSEYEYDLENLPQYSGKTNYLTTSLAKYYSDMLPNYSPALDMNERNISGTDVKCVRITPANVHVPSTISLDRLRAIRPPSPQSSDWLSRAHYSNPSLPTTSARWPESSVDALPAHLVRKQAKKSYKVLSNWNSPSRVGVNSDYREAWDKLRANYVEVKNTHQPTYSDVPNEPVKRDAKDTGKTSHEKSTSQKKTAAKPASVAKEKAMNFKLKPVPKLPAPPARSEEDTWCYSVNAMLLKAKQVMADSQDQKKGTHRFPRHNSAAVVSPVIEQKATSNFLKTLLKQDAEDIRRNKATAHAHSESGIKQQRERIRHAMSNPLTRKVLLPGRTVNNSCSVISASSLENNNGNKSPCGADDAEKRPGSRRWMPTDGACAGPSADSSCSDRLSALRISRPLDLKHSSNARSYRHVHFTPDRPDQQRNPGTSYIIDRALNYFDYPYITESSIVPMFGNTNTNASSGVEANARRNIGQGEQIHGQNNISFSHRSAVQLEEARNAKPGGNAYFKKLWDECGYVRNEFPSMSLIQSLRELSNSKKSTKSRRTEVLGRQLLNLPVAKRLPCQVHENACQDDATDETLNNGVLLECLLRVGRKARTLRQFRNTSDGSGPSGSLASAKAKAEAAFEEFLSQNRQSETIDLLREPEAVNPRGKAFQRGGLHRPAEDAHDDTNVTAAAASDSDKQNSSLATCTFSSGRTFNSGIIDVCRGVNAILEDQVYRKSYPKTKNARKTVIKQGRFPFGHTLHARPATPPFISTLQNKSDYAEKTWGNRQKPRVQERFRRFRTTINHTHFSFKAEDEYEPAASNRSRGTKLTKTLSSKTHLNGSYGIQLPGNPKLWKYNYTTEDTGLAQEHGLLEIKKLSYASLKGEQYLQRKQISAGPKTLDGSTGGLKVGLRKKDVKNTGKDRDCNNRTRECEGSGDFLKQNNKDTKGCDVGGEVTQESLSGVKHPAKVVTEEYGTKFDKEIKNDDEFWQHGTECDEECNEDEELWQHGEELGEENTGEEELFEPGEELGEEEDRNSKFSGICVDVRMGSNRKSEYSDSDGDFVEEDDDDLSQEWSGIQTCSCVRQPKDSVVLDELNDPEKAAEDENSDRCEACEDGEEFQVNIDEFDPDYLHVPGYDFHSTSSLKIRERHLKEMLHASIYSSSSSMTSVNFPPLPDVNSETSLPCVSDAGSGVSGNLIPGDLPVPAKVRRTRAVHPMQGSTCVPPCVSGLNDAGHQTPKPPCCSFLSLAQSRFSLTPSPVDKLGIPPTTGDQGKTLSAVFETGHANFPGPYGGAANVTDDANIIVPPPPSPTRPREGLTSMRFSWRAERLLPALNAAATGCVYMPAVRLADWHMSLASASVIKVFYCTGNTARPQIRVDKDGYLLGKVSPYTVFYRQDKHGVPACLYSVQWLDRGLYTLRNRDVIREMDQCGVVKLGALLDHAIQASTSPPRRDHYPLLLLGAPANTREKAQRRAHRVYIAAYERGRVSVVMDKFLGVTPWWSQTKHENKYVRPDELSTCVTTQRCGSVEDVYFKDWFLREMLMSCQDVRRIIDAFQNLGVKASSDTALCRAAADSADGCHVLQNAHMQRKFETHSVPVPGVCCAPTADNAALAAGLRKAGQEPSSKWQRLPSICRGSSLLDTRNLLDPEPLTEFSVVGSKSCITARCCLPQVRKNATHIKKQRDQRNPGLCGVERIRLPRKPRPSSGKSVTSETGAEIPSKQLSGWEWSETVLPPPFPATLRRNRWGRGLPFSRRRNFRTANRLPGSAKRSRSRKKRRSRSTDSSLKSYSSAPSVSSSSSSSATRIDDGSVGEDIMLEAALKECFQRGQATAKLSYVFNKILSNKIRKLTEAKNQKEKEQAEQERRVLGRGAGGDKSTSAHLADGKSPQPCLPRSTPTTGQAVKNDEPGDSDKEKELRARCFPEVRYSRKKQRFCKVKSNPSDSRKLFAKAAVMLGIRYSQ
ncbi:hypothetical protein EGW08_005028 [Elysia chlorotica]|uniref:Uncharacterized protein n=1 Tax=Elysia chlorotica TaxID=188477 RepID=A0A433U0B4_ELYCH|nr:hypothetical protein EGW08_005028 [Elysia chlorotica]